MDILVKGVRLVPSASKEKEGSKPVKGHNPWQIMENTKEGLPVLNKDDIQKNRSVYLSRKFSSLWILRTFGRVSPHKARTFANNQLQQKCFSRWYSRYWENRIEWKLEIRASCHNRFRLFAKCFNVWRQFIKLQQQKNIAHKRADTFGRMKLLQNVWRGWCLYSEICQQKKKLKSHAEAVANRSTVRLCWVEWKDSTNQRISLRHLENNARIHWTKVVLIKVWTKWHEELQISRETKDRILQAEQIHLRMLVCKVLSSWRAYWRDQVEYKQIKSRADSHYHHQLLKYFTLKWYKKWRLEEKLKHLESHVHRKCQHSVVNQLFQKWKQYVVLIKSNRRQLEQASVGYNMGLLRKCFHGLLKHKTQRRIEHLQRLRADSCRKRMLLLHCWKEWTCRFDVMEEQKLSVKTNLAYQHYRFSLAKVTYTAWCFYVEDNKVKKAKTVKALYLFKMMTLPRYFDMWKRYHSQKLYESTLKLSAVQFRSNTLMAMGYYGWFCAVRRQQEERRMESMAIDCYVCGVQRRIMRSWYQSTVQSIRYRQMESETEAQKLHKILTSAFLFWISRWKRTLLLKQHEVSAIGYHRHCYLDHYWHLWRECVASQTELHTRELCLYKQYTKKLLSTVYRSWKGYHLGKKDDRRRCSLALDHYHCTLLKQAFHSWKASVQYLKQIRIWGHLAAVRFNVRVQQKYFQAWYVKFLEAVYISEEEEQMYDLACVSLDRVKLEDAFRNWRSATIQCLYYKESVQKADELCRVLIQKKCLQGWVKYHTLCQHKMVLFRLSNWFFNRRLLALFYSTWKLQYADSQRENRKTIVALWHWNVKLKTKCFSSWLVYVSYKRRKRSRYSSALLEYRQRLLKIGVFAWFQSTEKTADEQDQSQEQEFKLIEANNTFTLKHCFHQWKKQALDKGCPCDIHPFMAVTFSDNKSCSIPRRIPKIPDFLKEGTQTSQLKEDTQTSQLKEGTLISQLKEEMQTSQWKEGARTSQLKKETQTSQWKEGARTSQLKKETQTSQWKEGARTSHPLIHESGTSIFTFSTLSDKEDELPGNHKEVTQGPISMGHPSSLKEQEILEKVMDTKQFLLHFYMMKSKLNSCREQLTTLLSDSGHCSTSDIVQVQQQLQDLTSLVAAYEPIAEQKMWNLNVTLNSLK